MFLRLFGLLGFISALSMMMPMALGQIKLIESDSIEYGTILDRIYEQRTKPLSFEVHVRHLTNSSTEVTSGQPIIFTTEINSTVRFDEIPGNLYVKRTVESDIANTTNAADGHAVQQALESSNPSYVLVVNEKGQFYISKGLYRRQQREPNQRSLLPFPWDNLGIVMPVELNAKLDFAEAIARNKKYFGKQELTVDRDGIATMDLRNQVNRVDTKRGYWPIEYLVENRRTIKGKEVRALDRGTKIKLVKVGEHWVPERVDLSTNSSSQSYFFTWKSFDSAIDDSNFDIEKIIEQESAVKEDSGPVSKLKTQRK